jgi:hypothetical protein
MQGNWVDYRVLVVGSQIANLTFDLSFGHNLCFKYQNELCEPILDIFISINFQWYKKIFNLICFDPCNCSLQIWKSIGTPIPKVGAHLGVWRFILSLSYTLGNIRCASRASLLFCFLASLCLGHEPEVKVVTFEEFHCAIARIMKQVTHKERISS